MDDVTPEFGAELLAMWEGQELQRKDEEKTRARKVQADKNAAALRDRVTGKG